MMDRSETRPPVQGLNVDSQTRCAHWRSPRDVVALKMACCGEFFACRQCHDALADHPAQVWPRESFDERAILCGVCGRQATIVDYLAADDACPGCSAAWNPGCRTHHHLYFESD